jgi:hypothetical protein
MAILTDDQKAAWKALAGEPFTHPVTIHKRTGAGGGFFAPGKLVPAVPALPAGNVLPIAPAQVVPAKPIDPQP